MPRYEFSCPRCDNRIELDLPVQHDPPVCCEDRGGSSCGAEMLKVISKTSFVLKGSGWAKDGYK